MRYRTLLLSAAAALVGAALPVAARAAARAPRFRPLSHVSDVKALQHLPGPFLTAPQTCTPDVNPDAIPGLTIPKGPELLGPAFDPADWDEISVAGGGGILAFASSVTEAGVPGAAKHVVLRKLAGAVETVRVPAVGAVDDQPSVQFDAFGYRCAFRSSTGTGAGPSNIQIYGFMVHGDTPIIETVAVTDVAGDLVAFDPALAARIRVREVGSGVKVRERDARVAFVSTDDLAAPDASQSPRNPDNHEQLFLWEEQDDRFLQLTRNTDAAAHVNRPAISKTGDIVYFESTADLVPASVEPLNASRVGNPDGFRQIFRWRRGRAVEQLTWADGDCFSPRTDVTGRFVLFSSRGDPFGGANADRNLEIFAWVANARPTLRLRQLTQTSRGDSVFPRPAGRPDLFVFYSTVHPPKDPPPDLDELLPPENVRPAVFGGGLPECAPQALLYSRRSVFHVHGFLDVENAKRLSPFPARTPGQQIPIITGPPAPGAGASRVFFATNDYRLNPKLPQGSTTPPDEASILALRIGVATRR